MTYQSHEIHYPIPKYVLTFTERTIKALLSQQAEDGQSVELDFNVDGDPQFTAVGEGRRHGDNFFVATLTTHGEEQRHEWNFDLLKDQARIHGRAVQ